MNLKQDVVTRAYQADFAELLTDLVAEIEIRNYRVTRINHIDNVLTQKERGLSGQMSFRHYKIVEFCNLNSCAQMMSSHPLSGLFMPVRFIAYQGVDEPSPKLSFLRPTRFAAHYDSPGVMEIAASLEQDMNEVLTELDS